jgi:hypothetical protein
MRAQIMETQRHEVDDLSLPLDITVRLDQGGVAVTVIGTRSDNQIHPASIVGSMARWGWYRRCTAWVDCGVTLNIHLPDPHAKLNLGWAGETTESIMTRTVHSIVGVLLFVVGGCSHHDPDALSEKHAPSEEQMAQLAEAERKLDEALEYKRQNSGIIPTSQTLEELKRQVDASQDK